MASIKLAVVLSVFSLLFIAHAARLSSAADDFVHDAPEVVNPTILVSPVENKTPEVSLSNTDSADESAGTNAHDEREDANPTLLVSSVENKETTESSEVSVPALDVDRSLRRPFHSHRHCSHGHGHHHGRRFHGGKVVVPYGDDMMIPEPKDQQTAAEVEMPEKVKHWTAEWKEAAAEGRWRRKRKEHKKNKTEEDSDSDSDDEEEEAMKIAKKKLKMRRRKEKRGWLKWFQALWD
ncbi:hypothetical protein Cni_G17036 [Canna indica]|uniref:Uncharacterized protein n=1 Tax=Canna indica TaxID=4628 RepID=A0AAQ3KGC8_9LILI|nr:hypothetical protein Cni_G17036 [Canna indica]